MENKLAVFEGRNIRRKWHEGEWYFSVVDVVSVLTESQDPKDYWYRLKQRELENGVELSTNCRQLKLPAADGKRYSTDGGFVGRVDELQHEGRCLEVKHSL